VTVEEAICQRVESLADVIALAGSRVYLDKAPQGDPYPVVVVQLIDDPDDYHLRGPDGARRARVQVDVYAHESSGVDAYDQATMLAEAINGDGLGPDATGLSGFIGTIGSLGLEVTGCFRIDRVRGYEAEDMRELRIRQDYYVHFRG
jgi:Protein of unknown function (DUF3168)